MISQTEVKEKLTVKQIFNQYYRNKFIFYISLFLIGFIGRYFNGHHKFEWSLTGGVFAFLIVVVLILGYMDYYFYEKTAKRLAADMLSQSPLKDFLKEGFTCEEENKMSGYINSFNIILAPLVNQQKKSFLAILIPLKVNGEAEKYFTDINEVFKFSFTGELLVARAVIENYTKDYDFEKLFNLLIKATELLIERKIEPLEIIAD